MVKVSKYDASVGAYREIELEDYELELKALSLPDEQVDEMVAAREEEAQQTAADILGVESLTKVSDEDGTVTYEAPSVVEEVVKIPREVEE
jgi:hypothetical protein